MPAYARARFLRLCARGLVSQAVGAAEAPSPGPSPCACCVRPAILRLTQDLVSLRPALVTVSSPHAAHCVTRQVDSGAFRSAFQPSTRAPRHRCGAICVCPSGCAGWPRRGGLSADGRFFVPAGIARLVFCSVLLRPFAGRLFCRVIWVDELPCSLASLCYAGLMCSMSARWLYRSFSSLTPFLRTRLAAFVDPFVRSLSFAQFGRRRCLRTGSAPPNRSLEPLGHVAGGLRLWAFCTSPQAAWSCLRAGPSGPSFHMPVYLDPRSCAVALHGRPRIGLAASVPRAASRSTPSQACWAQRSVQGHLPTFCRAPSSLPPCPLRTARLRSAAIRLAFAVS